MFSCAAVSFDKFIDNNLLGIQMNPWNRKINITVAILSEKQSLKLITEAAVKILRSNDMFLTNDIYRSLVCHSSNVGIQCMYRF